MKGMEPFWPKDLGDPSTSGSQNGMKYAFFPDKQRLVIERDGQVSTYDSGDHRIGGVSQADGASKIADLLQPERRRGSRLAEEARLIPSWTGPGVTLKPGPAMRAAHRESPTPCAR